MIECGVFSLFSFRLKFSREEVQNEIGDTHFYMDDHNFHHI